MHVSLRFGIGSIADLGVQVKKKTPGRSKYGVRIDRVGKAARTMDNITFDSLKEMRRYADLKLLEKAGKVFGLTLQPRYALEVDGVLICRYVADFRYFAKEDGVSIEIVEDVKGVKTPAYKIKKQLMWAIYGIAIKEV